MKRRRRSRPFAPINAAGDHVAPWRPQPASVPRAASPWVVAYIGGRPYTAAMLERRAARLATCPESAALEGDDQIVYVGEGQGHERNGR